MLFILGLGLLAWMFYDLYHARPYDNDEDYY
jgi:hypothetical protein